MGDIPISLTSMRVRVRNFRSRFEAAAVLRAGAIVHLGRHGTLDGVVLRGREGVGVDPRPDRKRISPGCSEGGRSRA